MHLIKKCYNIKYIGNLIYLKKHSKKNYDFHNGLRNNYGNTKII